MDRCAGSDVRRSGGLPSPILKAIFSLTWSCSKPTSERNEWTLSQKVCTFYFLKTGQKAADSASVYEADLDKLTDERIAVFKDFSEHLDTMTDDKARDLAQKNIAIEEKRARLKKDYFAQFAKATSAKTAARFMQVDNHVDLLVNLQVIEQIPLVN